MLASVLATASLLVCISILVRKAFRRLSATKHFYGEDRRHAVKAAKGYHGFRLVLSRTLNQAAVRERLREMLAKEGAHSMLRIRFTSAQTYAFSTAPDSVVVDDIIQVGKSGADEPSAQRAVADEMWAAGRPLRLYFDGKRLDLLAHHAVFDGVRGVRLLNEVLGNLARKGAIRPGDLPCCLLACAVPSMLRILTVERPRGTLGTAARALGDAHHESHYLHVPTALVKEAKERHGLGFAPALQGVILHALFQCGVMPPELHVACTVGFKSDAAARLGSEYNHYGAFPIRVPAGDTPQQLAKGITRSMKRNGKVSGLPCLLANASLGGVSGLAGSIADMYNQIDVLIGGGPLIMDPGCGYESYALYKFEHTVPVYIFYATLCDTVDVSVQSRVPLPGLAQAFDEAVARLQQGALPAVHATPTTHSVREQQGKKL